MNDEAESSRAGERTHHGDNDGEVDFDSDAIPDAGILEEEDEVQREQRVKERRLDAKRKRIAFLDHLLRQLDTLVFVELITLYHLDCSFFWFTIRAFIHGSLLTPLPDIPIPRGIDEHKPFLPLILFCFAVNFALHLIYPAPSAGEDTRGYLHGGLMIDFIGQQGPTSKWKLVGLDTCLLLLQLTMVSVHVKRRVLKKKLGRISGGSTSRTAGEAEAGEAGDQPPLTEDTATEETEAREQDADAEERGVLRRTDTLSDIGAADEEDALLPSAEGHQTDALDILTSGQCVIGEFTLIDTLIQEHREYSAFRRTRTEAGAGASSSIPPSTLRQLQSIRMRFGVGGG